MTNILLAGVVAAAAVVSISAPAAACPSGYVKGWIQGHRICHLPPGGNNQFQANAHAHQGKRGSHGFEIKNLMSTAKAQARRGEKKRIRPAQRAFE